MNQRDPRLPFEHWALDGAGARSISRPLLYALQHLVLPQAVHQGHPILRAALSDQSLFMPGFAHMVALSSVRCEGANGWPADVSEDEAYYNYKDSLLQYVAVERYEHDGVANCVIRMPPPVAQSEAHFVAVWRFGRTGGPPRYFTLELSERPGSYFVCEWDQRGNHRTHGETQQLTSDGFDRYVQMLAGDA